MWIASFLAFAPFGQFWTTSWDGNSNGDLQRGWIAQDGSFHFIRDDRTVFPAPTSVPNRGFKTGIDPMPALHPTPTHFGFALRRKSLTHSRAYDHVQTITFTTQQLSFPIWLLALALAIVPSSRLVFATLRRRRVKAGRCPRCSYDLFANASGVCPECGLPLTTPSTD